MKQGCQKERRRSRAIGTASRSKVRRRRKRESQRVERAEAEAARLRREAKQLREQRDETRRRLELAQTQLLQQSLPENSEVAARFFQERSLRGHQYCVTLIALAIGQAKRVRIAHGKVLSRSRSVSWPMMVGHRPAPVATYWGSCSSTARCGHCRGP